MPIDEYMYFANHLNVCSQISVLQPSSLCFTSSRNGDVLAYTIRPRWVF